MKRRRGPNSIKDYCAILTCLSIIIAIILVFTFALSYPIITMCCEGHNFVAMLESREGDIIRFERPGCKICCCVKRFSIDNTKPTCINATSDYDSKCKCNYNCHVF